jgi:glucose/arabinose dehydrogenase
VRYRYQPGDQVARAAPEIVIPSLAPASTYGHSTRDLAISADGAHLHVSVGSASNVAEDMPRKTPAQIQAWEASRAAGAAWGAEENRADVLDSTSGDPVRRGYWPRGCATAWACRSKLRPDSCGARRTSATCWAMTGFRITRPACAIDDARVRGRPVGAAVSRDGSLLISDDGANVVHRISYAP